MHIKHFSEVEPQAATEGASGVKIRWLIKENLGARNFVMRHFEIEPHGHTPLHSHPWEHELFILSGSGTVSNAREEKQLKPGDVVFIPEGETHQFKNNSNAPFTLLCLIPSKDKCHL